MTKLPTIDVNITTGNLIFNNSITPSAGISGASAGSTLIFSESIQFQNVNSFGDYTQVPPTSIPDNPSCVYLPAIASGGVLQTTDILVCNSTINHFYCGSFKTHFYTDVTIDGNTINTGLTDIINNISTNSNIGSLSTIYQPIGSYALQSDITNLSNIYVNNNIFNNVTITNFSNLDVDNYIGSTVLSSLVTTGSNLFINNTTLNNALNNVNITNFSSLDVDNYLGITVLSSLVTTGSNLFQPRGQYVDPTTITGLSNVYQPVGNYALTSAITGLSSVYQPVGNYALASAISGLSSIYALTSTITGLSSVYQPVGNYALTSAITALSSVYQGIGNYALTSAITGLSSVYQAIGNYALTSAITGLSTVYQAIGNYALTSAITALSSVYQTICSYALTSAITGLTSIYAKLSSPSFTGTVKYNGTDLDTLHLPWVIATIDGTTGNVSSQSGKGSVSCSRSAAGSYTVNFTSTPSGAPTAVVLTIRNFTGFIQYSGLSGSSMNVSTRNTSSVLTDATFSVVVYLQDYYLN